MNDDDAFDRSYGLAVIGATPSGIVTAVRAAREGLSVLLVSSRAHIGGILSNGLSSWDTQFEGIRAVVQEDWLELVRSHYRDTYGEDSEEYRLCIDGAFGGGPHRGHTMFEPHVAEAAFESLLAAEPRVMVVREYAPVSVERAGRIVKAVFVVAVGSSSPKRVSAATFVDASYEGDMMALTGVEYHVGRESRAEYNEQHAGRIFLKRGPGAEEDFPVDDYGALRYPRAARYGRLKNIRPWFGISQEIFTESTGEGDKAVQASNYRLTLGARPENRRAPVRPDNYDRTEFLPVAMTPDDSGEIVPIALKIGLVVNDLVNFPGWLPVPNGKADWNMGSIPGGLDDFPDGDDETRAMILQRHKDVALGLLYFLQTDETVPEKVREEALQYGLPTDEFVDNDGFPREWYLREARRMVGRTVFTENDARYAVGLQRAPIHDDSIAFCEWLLDSHDCTPLRVQGSLGDGFTTLTEVTRPGQVPYSSLLPKDVDNLLVTGTPSASHMGWGTLRVEPTLTHIAESAGYAAALAASTGVPVAKVNVPMLQHRLVENGIVITFFNEFDGSSTKRWAPAIQFLGTRGFFGSYDARPDEPLDALTAVTWARTIGQILDGDHDMSERARALVPETPPIHTVSGVEFSNLVRRELEYRDLDDGMIGRITARLEGATEPIQRWWACELAYGVLIEILGQER